MIFKINGAEIKIIPDVYYNFAHEWIRIEKNNLVVGLTDYAQQQLGEISMVELLKQSLPGSKVQQVQFKNYSPITEPIPDVTVESAKSVNELYSPLSGVIIQVNIGVMEDPELINKDPYNKGWLFKLSPTKWDEEMKSLLDSNQYLSFLQTLS